MKIAMKRPTPTSPRFTSALCLLSLALAALLLPNPVSAQEQYEYPDPFPGGYPSLSGASGAGRMYMESYFPPPVTASPTYPAWSPDGESFAFAYQGRIWIVPVEGGTARQVTTGPGYHSQPTWVARREPHRLRGRCGPQLRHSHGGRGDRRVAATHE